MRSVRCVMSVTLLLSCEPRKPTLTMVTIPEGPFPMGCAPTDTACHADENPLHTVTLSAYEIAAFPVTQADFKTCIDAGACSIDPAIPFDPDQRPNAPIRDVTWFQAADFCRWMRKRLPTEAEWEKAARGTTPRLYPWGDEAPCSSNVPPCYVATYEENVSGPVDSHPESDSPYGVHDMAGAVWNWVSDTYDPNFYAASPLNDPTGPAGIQSSNPDDRVIRGGGYALYPDGLRVSHRAHMDGHTSTPIIGFRCAGTL